MDLTRREVTHVHCPDSSSQSANAQFFSSAWSRDASTYCLASLPRKSALEGEEGPEVSPCELLALDFTPGTSSACALSSGSPLSQGSPSVWLCVLSAAVEMLCAMACN